MSFWGSLRIPNEIRPFFLYPNVSHMPTSDLLKLLLSRLQHIFGSQESIKILGTSMCTGDNTALFMDIAGRWKKLSLLRTSLGKLKA